MKSSLLALVSLLVVAPFTSLATDVRYCDKKKNYDVQVSGVEITPYPIARGQPATFSISASAGGSISAAKMTIDVAYFGWHVHSESHDLCEETSCPVSSGDFLISHSQVLPVYTPPGSYSLTMKMHDGSNRELTCISFDFDVGFLSSVADS